MYCEHDTSDIMWGEQGLDGDVFVTQGVCKCGLEFTEEGEIQEWTLYHKDTHNIALSSTVCDHCKKEIDGINVPKPDPLTTKEGTYCNLTCYEADKKP